MPGKTNAHDRGLTRFFVLTTQRSGSTWFLDLLNSNEQIMAFNELFLNKPSNSAYRNCRYVPEQTFYDFNRAHRRGRPGIVFDYMDYLAGLADGYGAVGYKLMYNHLERFPEMLYKAVRDRYRIIHLYRPNHFDRIVSEEFTRVSKVLHSDTSISQKQVSIDPDTIIWRLRKKKWQLRTVRWLLTALPLQTLEVTYDSLRDTPERTMGEISSFLSVPPQPCESSFKKIVRRDHQAMIYNYHEVAARIDNTEFSSMLDQA